jgi:hypothetical protein
MNSTDLSLLIGETEDDDYSVTSFEYTIGSQERLDFDTLTNVISDPHLSKSHRISYCNDYMNIDSLTLIECINNVITTFIDNRLSYLEDIIRQFCEMHCLPLQIRIKCAQSVFEPICSFLNDDEKTFTELDHARNQQTKKDSISLQLHICEDALSRHSDIDFNHTLLFEVIISITKEDLTLLDIDDTTIQRCVLLVQNILVKQELNESYRFRLFVYLTKQWISSSLDQNNITNQDSFFKTHLQTISLAFLNVIQGATYGVLVAQFIPTEYLPFETLQRLVQTDLDAAEVCDFILRCTENCSIETTQFSWRQWALERLHSIKGVSKNLFISSQNLHSVSVDIESFVEKVIEFDTATLSTLLNRYPHHESTFDRIVLDQQLYSSKALTISTLLFKCWSCIQLHEHREELEKRLDQELTDMKDTCTSGHMIRLMNVFSGWMEGIKLDVRIEIQSVVFYRLQKMIETLEEDKRDSIIEELGKIDVVEEGIEQQNIQSYLFKDIAILHDELLNDYRNILEEQKFDEYFRNALLSFTIETID